MSALAITPHLVVRDAAAAAEWYTAALGAEEHGRLAVPGGKLMQLELRFGSATVMLADEFPDMGVLSPLSIGGTATVLHLSTDDVDAVWQRAIDGGAEVRQPLAEAFWGERYGQITDPFGHRWGLAQHVRDVPREQLERAVAELVAGDSVPRRPMSRSAKRHRNLLQQVERVLHARLHARADVGIAPLLGGVFHQHGQERAAVPLGQGEGVQGRVLLGVGDALVDLGRDDPLVRDDLPVLAVERDLHAALGHAHVPFACHQRLTSSGVVQALYTRCLGASNSRVIRICRSVGSVTVAVPLLVGAIVDLLRL
jgi:PhnB protein